MRIGLEELEGEVISGRYKILRRIGKGGMGVVYLAQQTNLNRNVCLKVLNPALLDDEDAVGRFEREAKGLSRLQHPNIVTIFDYGRDGDLAYIVMEYAQGATLSKYIKAHGPMTLDEFLPIAVQTLKGIGEAHKLGLIHRDIKPANIILAELEGEANFVKILDFGLAKLAQGQEDLTKEQQLVGSASYMSPEQILTGASDTRTDVYALGVMFYLMISGRKPFSGTNDNVVLYKHVNEIPSPLKSLVDESQRIPETLCEVIDQCLMKDPDKRPQTALDLLKAMSFALDAPQLSASFSSMSLAKVDLQKVSDDAETHFMGSSQPSGPLGALAGVQAAVAQEADTKSGSGFSSVTSNSGVSASGVAAPLYDPTKTFPAGSSQAARDRKVLIVVIVVVSAIVAIVVGIILASSTGTEQTPQFVEDTQNDEFEEILSAIERMTAAGQCEDALNVLKRIEAMDVAKEGKNMVLVYERKSGILSKLLESARTEREQGEFEEAERLYKMILAEDSNHVQARQELDALDADIVKTGKVSFAYEAEHTDKMVLYINGQKYEGFPETLELIPGEHELKVERDGYQAWERKVMVEVGGNLELTIALEAIAEAEKAPEAQPADNEPVKKESTKKNNGLLNESQSDGLLLDSGSKKKKSKSKSKNSGLLL